MKRKLSLGIDIGSTTTKLVLMDGETVLYEKYQRHLSRVRQTTLEMLREMQNKIQIEELSVTVSGSAGMGVADAAGLPFVQEVYATGEVVEQKAPDTGVVIELGGEDAKVIFFGGGVDERMNGSCAGGTGAFIDQMAVLLDMTVDEMDTASLSATKIYPIASRCGVFAKTDIQPLLNQGASKADAAASIFQAVVNQTITGLIQGRKIEGKVMFLGGPLYYCHGLQKRFYETLKLNENTAVFPEYALYAVAMGAAMVAKNQEPISFDSLLRKIENSAKNEAHGTDRLSPLFTDETEYEAFRARHERASVPTVDINTYRGNAWLGIDCGSTTTKLVLISEDKEIIKTVAQRSGLTENTVEKEGEYSTTSLLLNVATHGISGYDVSNKDNMLMRDIVNAYQTEYIMEVAEKGPCVIVGRSADYILQDRENCLNVFIHGDLADRAKRVVEEHGIAPLEAEKHVLERDKKRAKYYRHITDQVWGLAQNYDLCLNTSKLGIDGCVDLILSCCK